MPLHHEASHPSLHAAVLIVVCASRRVELLIRGHRVLLDLEAECEDGWERVGELHCSKISACSLGAIPRRGSLGGNRKG